MYTQKIAIIFDHNRLCLENKFVLDKKTQSPTYSCTTTFMFTEVNWTTPKCNFIL